MDRTTLKLKMLALAYWLAAATVVLGKAYDMAFVGLTRDSPTIGSAILPLAVGYGLLKRRPWGRWLAYVLSVFLAVCAVVGLALSLAHVLGVVRASGGTIVDHPTLTIIAEAQILAFFGWQAWFLARPSVRALFATEAAAVAQHRPAAAGASQAD